MGIINTVNQQDFIDLLKAYFNISTRDDSADSLADDTDGFATNFISYTQLGNMPAECHIFPEG